MALIGAQKRAEVEIENKKAYGEKETSNLYTVNLNCIKEIRETKKNE